MNKDKNKLMWYNNSDIITNIIIGLIVLIIILSQSFAINNNLSATNIIRDIINHNILYFFVLIYFVLLKFKVGKRYFNYLNLFLTLLYLISTVTSILSVFQLITVSSVLALAIKVIILVYLVHIMFTDTRYYDDLKISKSLFNDISNDTYFSSISVLSLILLAINLIFVESFDGAVLTILDSIFYIVFARYIYLYREYLDFKSMVEFKKIVEKSKGDK